MEFNEGLESIGKSAFENCSSLNSAILPSTVTHIDESSFKGCKSLTSLGLSNGLTSIGNNAFSGCESLESVNIPTTVVSLGEAAFGECKSLIKISFNGTVDQWQSIQKGNGWSFGTGDYYIKASDGKVSSNGTTVYYSFGLNFTLNSDGASYSVSGRGTCTSTELVIPDTYEGLPVTHIASRAFENWALIKSVIIPEGVTVIGSYAFAACKNLSTVIIPNTVTTIGGHSFRNCTSLDSLYLPEGVVSIGEYAFYYSDIMRINLPSTLTSIGNLAFEYCYGLRSVIIPKNVTNLGRHVFTNCSSAKFYCEAESKPSGWDSKWNGSNRPVTWGFDIADYNYICTLNSDGFSYSISEYIVNGNIDVIIPSSYDGHSITKIGKEAFYFCGSIRSILIPTQMASMYQKQTAD